MRQFLNALSRHLLIFISLSLVMLVIVFISGQFTVLHEDAYVDGVMSIVYVYAVILIAMLINKGLNHYVASHPSSWIKKVQSWHEESGILITIAIGFTLITVINSAMMVTGVDVPKTGSFAYLHLLVRLMIVSAAVILWMHKEAIQFLRQLFRTNETNGSTVSTSMKEKVRRLFIRPFEASTACFTIITVVGCLGMLGLSRFVDVQAGEPLYLALMILYGLLYIGLKIFYIIFQTRSRKRDTA